jgi:hypothetical protein
MLGKNIFNEYVFMRCCKLDTERRHLSPVLERITCANLSSNDGFMTLDECKREDILAGEPMAGRAMRVVLGQMKRERAI